MGGNQQAFVAQAEVLGSKGKLGKANMEAFPLGCASTGQCRGFCCWECSGFILGCHCWRTRSRGSSGPCCWSSVKVGKDLKDHRGQAGQGSEPAPPVPGGDEESVPPWGWIYQTQGQHMQQLQNSNKHWLLLLLLPSLQLWEEPDHPASKNNLSLPPASTSFARCLSRQLGRSCQQIPGAVTPPRCSVQTSRNVASALSSLAAGWHLGTAGRAPVLGERSRLGAAAVPPAPARGAQWVTGDRQGQVLLKGQGCRALSVSEDTHGNVAPGFGMDALERNPPGKEPWALRAPGQCVSDPGTALA